ncbi:hypothetical protein [Streptomyces sp. MJM8645]|uniref:hypothetical protein n=1 Tax=Streptomycetaceae TaxID=2062 RepID=UPI0007AF5FDE|nr:hypothetical protein [Streptomyces sp. MJM8645]
MATNTSSKNAPPAASGEPDQQTVVGPPLGTGQDPEKVRLSHHLFISGQDYLPGADVWVAPDYARQLRANGYVARR